MEMTSKDMSKQTVKINTTSSSSIQQCIKNIYVHIFVQFANVLDFSSTLLDVKKIQKKSDSVACGYLAV